MKIKRRKAWEPVGELVNGSEAHIRWSGRVLATGLARSSGLLRMFGALVEDPAS
jgi:hypothetical protein